VIVNCLEIRKSVQNIFLNHLLPPRKDNDIELRPAGHDFLLPTCNYELHRRSFVVRCLFRFFNCLTCVFTLIVDMFKAIHNRIMCVCHLIIKDYLITYLLTYLHPSSTYCTAVPMCYYRSRAGRAVSVCMCIDVLCSM